MPSIQAKMISGLFKLIGVNRMLDKQGADLLTEYDASSVRFFGKSSGGPYCDCGYKKKGLV